LFTVRIKFLYIYSAYSLSRIYFRGARSRSFFSFGGGYHWGSSFCYFFNLHTKKIIFRRKTRNKNRSTLVESSREFYLRKKMTHLDVRMLESGVASLHKRSTKRCAFSKSTHSSSSSMSRKSSSTKSTRKSSSTKSTGSNRSTIPVQTSMTTFSTSYTPHRHGQCIQLKRKEREKEKYHRVRTRHWRSKVSIVKTVLRSSRRRASSRRRRSVTYRRERSYVPRRMRETRGARSSGRFRLRSRRRRAFSSRRSSTMKPDDVWDAMKRDQWFALRERGNCRIISQDVKGEERHRHDTSSREEPRPTRSRSSGRLPHGNVTMGGAGGGGTTSSTRSPKQLRPTSTRENSRSPRAGGTRSPKLHPLPSGGENARSPRSGGPFCPPQEQSGRGRGEDRGDLTLPGTGDLSRIRMVCISDLHGKCRTVEKLPAGDILIVAGDISDQGRPEEVLDFADWIDQQDFPVKIVIAGNHDVSLDEKYYHRKGKDRFKLPKVDPQELVKKLKSVCCYLEDESARVFPLKDGSGGLRVWGTPWQPKYCDWAFNRPRGRRLARKWERIPTHSDLVVVHGPPLGRGDRTKSGQRAGCIDLLREIQERVRPQLLVNGHIHEGYGVCNDGVTTFVNAAVYTSRSKPIRKPIVIDFMAKRPIDKSTGFVFK